MDPELEIQPGEYRHTAPPLTLSRSLRFLLNAPRRGDNPAAHRGSVRPDATQPTANANAGSTPRKVNENGIPDGAVLVNGVGRAWAGRGGRRLGALSLGAGSTRSARSPVGARTNGVDAVPARCRLLEPAPVDVGGVSRSRVSLDGGPRVGCQAFLRPQRFPVGDMERCGGTVVRGVNHMKSTAAVAGPCRSRPRAHAALIGRFNSRPAWVRPGISRAHRASCSRRP